MQALFDIAGDLDTPVSAYMKLAAFEPRFLLESVEGGERLARYSFIGLGTGLEVRLDERGFAIGSQLEPLPASGAELLAGLRTALKAGSETVTVEHVERTAPPPDKAWRQLEEASLASTQEQADAVDRKGQ